MKSGRKPIVVPRYLARLICATRWAFIEIKSKILRVSEADHPSFFVFFRFVLELIVWLISPAGFLVSRFIARGTKRRGRGRRRRRRRRRRKALSIDRGSNPWRRRQAISPPFRFRHSRLSNRFVGFEMTEVKSRRVEIRRTWLKCNWHWSALVLVH